MNNQPTANIIITNAHVYTVDDTNPHAEAVAIQGNSIIYVGSAAEAMSYRADNTRVINGEGRTLLPGFIDSHYHLQWGSATLYGAQLNGVSSMDELTAVLRAWMDEHPDAPWVVGEGAPYTLPTPDQPMTRDVLDAIVDDRPLVLMAFDQHSMFANTAALREAGILQGASEPMSNGEIPLSEDGLATGELYEMDAMAYIRRAMPEQDLTQSVETLKKGLALSASYGITSVHNMDGDIEQARLYAHMEQQGELSLRVYIPFWVKPYMNIERMVGETTAMQTLLTDEYGCEKVRGGVVKFFMDGVYESHTAVTLDGYPDQPDNFGEPIWDAETFAEFASEADRRGYQIAVHACGNGAVRRVLDGYANAKQRNGSRDSRHRVEHIEVIHPDDVPRFAKLGVTASMQPLHSPLEAGQTGDVWLSRIHPHNYDNAFAWRTLRNANAHIAFGSDWPVVTNSPFIGLHAALNRQPWAEGTNSHNQTLAEAIYGYTKGAAYTEFQEDVKGQIKVGTLADLVLLSRDIFAMSEAELRTELAAVEAVLTICDGEVVYE
ncbi:MAG: amidohydrolase [Chloroflexota bacterium]